MRVFSTNIFSMKRRKRFFLQNNLSRFKFDRFGFEPRSRKNFGLSDFLMLLKDRFVFARIRMRKLLLSFSKQLLQILAFLSPFCALAPGVLTVSDFPHHGSSVSRASLQWSQLSATVHTWVRIPPMA